MKRCKYGRVKSGARAGKCKLAPRRGRSRGGRFGTFGAFTRQHYNAIAKILKDSGCSSAVGDFSRLFAADNPAFKPDLFRRAAGG